jgi:uncharacterized protein YdhG (YjbR/CyaY superfamily)
METQLKSIDDYFSTLTPDKRAALERLRKIIHAAVPGAEECISYQIPAFRLDGKIFMWIGATAKHCAIYGAVGANKADLKNYDVGKGTIRFQPDDPLPATLVRKLIKTRIARNKVEQRARAGRAKRRR